MNKEKLRERCYEMGNSKLPVDVFYNDIRDNKEPNFNKDEAYADLEKIVDYIEKLQKENQELRKENDELLIRNEKLDTRIATLEELCNINRRINDLTTKAVEENIKLKKAIEILKYTRVDWVELKFSFSVNEYNIAIENTDFDELTQEQYELLKDVLGNKWYNKPLPAFAPEENYDYSFTNGCFQKAEKYDCEGLEKENQELKKIIKLLEDNLQLVLKQDIDPLLNRKVYAVGISKNYKLYSGFEVTQEEYELIKEVLEND